ncbi:unnamed protein product [Echinostoma caproni]|uniref:MADS-box domain-containing protein n=1 Tax=Echinostoma caproni TaxID=27848 RepID=A0A183B6Z4_9TREM|nr:unnamed protein product [Echinostoma caproni]
MGRKKIQIKPISDEKTRLVTFAKRKNGLFKKAYELSVLCQCEIAIIVFTKSNRLHQYASRTIDHALRRRETHARANEFCSNADMARVSEFYLPMGDGVGAPNKDRCSHSTNVRTSFDGHFNPENTRLVQKSNGGPKNPNDPPTASRAMPGCCQRG